MFEIIFIAVVIDVSLGEPPVIVHPVVFMGKLINAQRKAFESKKFQTAWGVIITLSTISVTLLIVYMILYYNRKFPFFLQILVFSLLLKTTFSIRLLNEIASKVKEYQDEKNLEKAQEKVSEIVSRDTRTLTEEGVTSAACESVAESITDSIVSPLFYYVIFGLYGAFSFRVINTLDSMIGYRNIEIGTFSARLDDILNFVPSRLAAVLILISGVLLGLDWRNGIRIFLRDKNKTESPNAGMTMAAMAGLLRIQLEKKDNYVLGDAFEKIEPHHISKALNIMKVSVLLFLVVILAAEVILRKV